MTESPERAALRELVEAVRPPNLEGDDWPARWRTGGPTASTLQERLVTACEKALALLSQTDEQRRAQALAEFEEHARAQGWTGNALRRQGWLAARGLL